jgi:tRNA G10  N-methylase Trm11
MLRSRLDYIRFSDILKDKIKWGISVYNDKFKLDLSIYNYLIDYFHSRFKHEGIRKAKKIIPSKNKIGQLEIISDYAIRHDLVNKGLDLLMVNIEDRFYIGKTVAIIDKKGYNQRDFHRPFQFSKISISPRFARMLVNLTGSKKSQLLLDPFCGIGTILQEALMMGKNILGLDINRNRVKQTLANLRWCTKSYKLHIKDINKKVLIGDATKLSKYIDKESVDAIATEPILLPSINKNLPIIKIKEMLSQSSIIYNKSLEEMVKVLKPNCRIVITIPYVKTYKGKVLSIPFLEIFRSLKLKLYTSLEICPKYPLFITSKVDDQVCRGIYVLEKT